MPYGLKPRPDAQCIHCNSLERHRFIWLFLETQTNLFNGHSKRMLHVAPEPCFEQKFRQSVGEGYITADLNNPRAQIKMDITDIPFEDQSFDIIYCCHVLEHVPDDRKALREFYRVLSKQGWAILVVPINAKQTFEDAAVTDPKEREKAFGQWDHVRVYGPDFIDRIKEAGFHVEKFTPVDFLSETQIRQYGTTRDSSLYYCTR